MKKSDKQVTKDSCAIITDYFSLSAMPSAFCYLCILFLVRCCGCLRGNCGAKSGASQRSLDIGNGHIKEEKKTVQSSLLFGCGKSSFTEIKDTLKKRLKIGRRLIIFKAFAAEIPSRQQDIEHDHQNRSLRTEA